jgi:hypothetical protein
MSSLISSHINFSKDFVNLVKNATKQSLIIYSHREETDRLQSAIIEIAAMKKCTKEDVYEASKCELKGWLLKS